MITEETFTENWIRHCLQKQGIRNLDRNKFLFVEKMNHAILLAELLKIKGLDFIFKGGTSLILLLDQPQRFSIDLDIITQTTQQEIENILMKICQNSRFKRFELDEREDKGISKAHYRLFFEAQFANSPNDNKILLDIVFGKNPYPKTQEMALQKEWLHTLPPITTIQLPTMESIFGDKLTAFAPNTIGIRYGEGKHIEIIKQLFDLGQLFDKIDDWETVIDSFFKNTTQELQYRQLNILTEQVLEDTWQTCLAVLDCFETNSDPKKEELKRGIQGFGSWTIQPFRKENAFEVAGKVAYTIAKIRAKNTESLKKFDPETMKITDFEIGNDLHRNFPNKRLKVANHALFYWYQAFSITKNP